MARYIFCKACDEKNRKAAMRYNEFYESIEGLAKADMFCDGSCFDSQAKGPTPIRHGEQCFAAVLLDGPAHENYEWQKPETWAHEYINPKTVAHGKEERR